MDPSWLLALRCVLLVTIPLAGLACTDSSSSGCGAGGECPEGAACYQGRCASPCAVPGDCPSELGCRDGVCQTCTADEQCADDFMCELADGVCLAPCEPGYGDCDGHADNGCETQLGTDAHCAHCTDVCEDGQSCVSGLCTDVGTCSDGRQNQDETGVDCGGARCSPCPVFVRAFYVSSSDANRSDANAGTVEEPWETLARVAAEPLAPGDAVLFKRGDTFRGTLVTWSSGSADEPIILSAYGEGARPLILGSKDLSATDAWTEDDTNVWRTSAGISASGFVGNLIFDHEASCGLRKISLAELGAQGDFFFDEAGAGDGSLYLYSVGNPATRYSHIEAGGVFSENVVSLESVSYLTVSNLDVRYSANNGIFLRGADHVIVEDCGVSWIGGMYYQGGPVRMGNGIQMWVDNSNITLRYNRIDQIYDAGISPQGGGTYTQELIQMEYNVISNCWYSYEVFTYPGSTLQNVNFDNNTCVAAGSQWSANQRPDTDNARHVMNWDGGGTVTSCSIRNNIFKDSADTAFRFNDEVAFEIDYNLYQVATLGTVSGESCTSLADWQARTSGDHHSLSGDPLFVSPSDFHLQASSPAIDQGTALGATRDYDGNLIQGLPDLGAFERP